MKTIDRVNRLTALVFAVFAVIFSSISFADDADDVMAVIQQYGDLEGDLEAQANLMRSDRVHIVGGNRQTNQAKNREIQLATARGSERRENSIHYNNRRFGCFYSWGRCRRQFQAMVEYLSRWTRGYLKHTSLADTCFSQRWLGLVYQTHACFAGQC